MFSPNLHVNPSNLQPPRNSIHPLNYIQENDHLLIAQHSTIWLSRHLHYCRSTFDLRPASRECYLWYTMRN